MFVSKQLVLQLPLLFAVCLSFSITLSLGHRFVLRCDPEILRSLIMLRSVSLSWELSHLSTVLGWLWESLLVLTWATFDSSYCCAGQE